MYDEVRSHLKQLLDNAVIRPSHSPFASSIVIVRKKNGTIRMCVDYRQLNKQSKKDSYTIKLKFWNSTRNELLSL